MHGIALLCVLASEGLLVDLLFQPIWWSMNSMQPELTADHPSIIHEHANAISTL
jgi:hypothetical protein